MLQQLPIDDILPEFLEAIRHGSVVLRAPPGAGKTTRVPPAMLDGNLADGTRIVVVQPRRLAARSAARRIAQERGTTIGGEVGYAVRFDARFTPETKILVVTDGVLLRMLQDDPLLEDVGIVVFDEFHERSLQVDLAFAMACRVREVVRPDLRLVVMSATLDPQPIVEFLQDASSVHCEGRLFPVNIQYTPRSDRRSIVDLVVNGVEKMLEKSAGDLLAFLPGVGEILQAQRRLQASLRKRDIVVQVLYGNMSAEQQDKVMHSSGQRRVVLATNIAETSVTIDGITCVVDSGWARQLRYDPAVGLDRLELTPISQASAEQRGGRAGRLGPGCCLRLWEKSSQRARPEFDSPEVRRADLSSAILQLLCWGEKDIRAFPWFEAPSTETIESSLVVLRCLGALDANGVTSLGRSMGTLPLSPRLARLVLEGYRQQSLRRAALAAALLSERDPFERPRVTTYRRESAPPPENSPSTSDVLDRVEAVERFQESGETTSAIGSLRPDSTRNVLQAARQIEKMVQQLLGPGQESESERQQEDGLLRSLFVAYSDRVARRRGPRDPRAVMGRGGKGVRLAPTSRVVDGEFFVCVDIDGRKGEATVRQASLVQRSWLEGDGMTEENELFFHPTQKRVVGRRNRYWGGLLLDEKPLQVVASDESAQLLKAAAIQAWKQVFPFDDRQLCEFLLRTRWLRGQLGEASSIPSWSERDLQTLLPLVCHQCLSLAEVAKADWKALLLGQLNFGQKKLLDQAAPEFIVVPSGRRIRLRYQENQPPILEVRIQEMFGLNETPRIALGQVAVLLHLLAPNNRPQQITNDLESFWRNTYPQVRRDLRGRYAKHSWPEDPLSAQPKSRPQRRRK